MERSNNEVNEAATSNSGFKYCPHCGEALKSSIEDKILKFRYCSECGSNLSADELLSKALRAICFTRDYVGEDLLPAIEGWEWYDAGLVISKAIPDDEWAKQFKARITPCPECNQPYPRHTADCKIKLNRDRALEEIGLYYKRWIRDEGLFYKL
jgi:hypothetical protein